MKYSICWVRCPWKYHRLCVLKSLIKLSIHIFTYPILDQLIVSSAHFMDHHSKTGSDPNVTWTRHLVTGNRKFRLQHRPSPVAVGLPMGYETWHQHYDDVIMGAVASQITSLTIVYSTVYSDADQRKHQRSASLAFVRGSHRGPYFPAQRASYAENVSIWWRHHELASITFF